MTAGRSCRIDTWQRRRECVLTAPWRCVLLLAAAACWAQPAQAQDVTLGGFSIPEMNGGYSRHTATVGDSPVYMSQAGQWFLYKCANSAASAFHDRWSISAVDYLQQVLQGACWGHTRAPKGYAIQDAELVNGWEEWDGKFWIVLSHAGIRNIGNATAPRCVTLQGFSENSLNAHFIARPTSLAFGKETFWAGSNEVFLFWCGHKVGESPLGQRWCATSAANLKEIQDGACIAHARMPRRIDLVDPALVKGWEEWSSESSTWSVRIDAGVRFVGPTGPDGVAPLIAESGSRSVRRELLLDETWEYTELSLRFGQPIYARVCRSKEAVWLRSIQRCAHCPEAGCILADLFKNVPGMFQAQTPGSTPECICGLSYEEIQLRSLQMPGDAGFTIRDGVRRVKAVLLEEITAESSPIVEYGTAIWQFDSLMVSVTCPSSQTSWPLLHQRGFNSVPAKNSLWWLRRFETAFGLENIADLQAYSRRVRDHYRAVFLIPVQRTKSGVSTRFGPTMDELSSCTLNFPYLSGPQGQRIQEIQVGSLPLIQSSCTSSDLQQVRQQTEAILQELPNAAKMAVQCKENWRTSLDPSTTSAASSTASQGTTVTTAGRGQGSGANLERVGILAGRSDLVINDPFSQNATQPPDCRTLRWQLRLKVYNLMYRALAYTATDAANGCWDFMERAVQFQPRSKVVVTDACEFEMEDPRYWETPCCNKQLARQSCCAAKTRNITEFIPESVNTQQLATSCKVDLQGRAQYARQAFQAALAWRRRWSEATSSGASSCVKRLTTRETVHVGMWRVLTRCHADIMGQYDRSEQKYLGAPCVLDEDCFTECVKPQLSTLRSYTSVSAASQQRRQQLGRCRVPTRNRHKYIIQCLVRRSNPEVIAMFAEELGLAKNDNSETAIIDVLPTAVGNLETPVCVGPFAAPGVSYTQQECLRTRVCNFNPSIRSEEECFTSTFGNTGYCTCAEGNCPQLSLKAGCRTATIVDSVCFEARKVLQLVELPCMKAASTPAEMTRCTHMVLAHEQMLRRCIQERCLPTVDYYHTDESCYDFQRTMFSSCNEECNIPSGPSPNTRGSGAMACYIQLEAHESALDCYRVRGDSSLHWAPLTGDAHLHIDRRERQRPTYCSVRVHHMRDEVSPLRSVYNEGLALAMRASDIDEEAESTAKQTERERRDAEVEESRNPTEFQGCNFGIRVSGSDAATECRARADTCCMSPFNFTHATCENCDVANNTVCRGGDRVWARWAPSGGYYLAELISDVGDGTVNLRWLDTDATAHTLVPWPEVFSEEYVLCVPEDEGCLSHSQCRHGEYCASCQGCADAFGGILDLLQCFPCWTRRGGACHDMNVCRPKQDSIDGVCDESRYLTECPCKTVWNVLGEFAGAPLDENIYGCFFDVSRGYSWCEVDVIGDCVAEPRVTGATRFFHWRRCELPACSYCHCDCGACMANNIIPRNGKNPADIQAGGIVQSVAANQLVFSGIIAPNCSEGGAARERDQCQFCTNCCADLCSASAGNMLDTFTSNASRTVASMEPLGSGELRDCTSTTATGCSDSPRGWVDSSGRSCADYINNFLCTFGGLPGPGWVYNPPLTFADFELGGRSADVVCCACGGGVDCTDEPQSWVDPEGYTCDDYIHHNWCNRTGYGPGWDPHRGPFQAGLGGKDAMAACCQCGGGRPAQLVEPQLNIISSEGECRNVWQERAVYGLPPWDQVSGEYCRFLNGICQRKLTAQVFDPGLQRGVPELSRIYQICEQRAYDVGDDFIPALEDDGTPANPGRRLALSINASGSFAEVSSSDRRLDALVREATRYLQPLEQALQRRGTTLDVDYVGNQGNGMCYYRIPDPLGAYGGPSRATMPPPWLPPPGPGGELRDVFKAPSIYALGWPFQFWFALPDATPVSQLPGGEALISNRLRALLAVEHIEFVQPPIFEGRLQEWWAQIADISCSGADSEFSKFHVDRVWEPGTLDLARTCIDDECDFDPHIHDEAGCASTIACDAHCAYCASRPLATRDAGICYTELPASVSQCDELGGTIIDDILFDERLGRDRHMRICAMPHRPLIFCTAPGEEIKRCIFYDEQRCERDPLAQLLGCGVDVRRCQTQAECDAAGWCSDRNIGLSWAIHGTCVISPLDDNLVREGCRGDYCYMRLDPAFGMEVRKRTGLLDLLSHDDLEAPASRNLAFRPGSAGNGTDHIDDEMDELRRVGRLSQAECEQFMPQQHGHSGMQSKSLWIEPARNMVQCSRWKGCCLEARGEECQLFAGAIVDTMADPGMATAQEEECASCGGEWTSVFQWETGEWRRGRMVNKGRWWVTRGMEYANYWQDLIDLDAIRHRFENAIEESVGEVRINCVRCLLEPLMSALSAVAEGCSQDPSRPNITSLVPAPAPLTLEEAATEEEIRAAEAAADADALREGQAQMDGVTPTWQASLGSATARSGIVGKADFGGVEVAWHEYSTAATNGEDVIYRVSLEPFEYELGKAGTQLALPGRASLARARMALYSGGDLAAATTTAEPVDEVNLASEPDGYPAWLVNEMIQLINPELLAGRETAATRASADAAREEQIRKRAEQADASTGLPEASVEVLLEDTGAVAPVAEPTVTAGAGGRIDLPEMDPTCRNVALNEFGEVIGYLQGDCFHLDASAPLANSVELCLPVAEMWGPESWINWSNMPDSVGLIHDFARKDIIPWAYNSTTPGSAPSWVLNLGPVAQALWNWESNPDYGRLPPDSAMFTSLGLSTTTRKNGSQLCAKVYEADTTYCPILRLNLSIYRPWPISEPTAGPPLNSTCEALDWMLTHVQGEHVRGGLPEAPYRRIDKTVSDPELQAARLAFVAAQGAEQAAEEAHRLKSGGASLRCSPGMCLMLLSEESAGLQLVPEETGGSNCVLVCPLPEDDEDAALRVSATSSLLILLLRLMLSMLTLDSRG